MGLCFAMFVFLTFRGPLASHDSNPYPNRSRIARYNATKLVLQRRALDRKFQSTIDRSKFSIPKVWEVLNGVGVDGVGGIFPFFSFFFFSFFFAFFRFFFRFSSFFFVFFRFSSLFFVFLRFFLPIIVYSWNKGKRLQFTGKMGNFTPTPSAPTPFGTSRKVAIEFFQSLGPLGF